MGTWWLRSRLNVLDRRACCSCLGPKEAGGISGLCRMYAPSVCAECEWCKYRCLGSSAIVFDIDLLTFLAIKLLKLNGRQAQFSRGYGTKLLLVGKLRPHLINRGSEHLCLAATLALHSRDYLGQAIETLTYGLSAFLLRGDVIVLLLLLSQARTLGKLTVGGHGSHNVEAESWEQEPRDRSRASPVRAAESR